MAFFRLTYPGGFSVIRQAGTPAVALKRAQGENPEGSPLVEQLTAHALWVMDESKAALPPGARAVARKFGSRHRAELAKAARKDAAVARRIDRREAQREAQQAEREAKREEAKRLALREKRPKAAKARRAKPVEALEGATR